MIAKRQRASPETSLFFCCDIQASSALHEINYPTMTKNAARLAQTADLL